MDNDTRSHQAELALIGSILAGASMPEFIQPEHFHWQAFGDFWKACKTIIAHGMTPDAITVGDQMERDGTLNMFMFKDDGGNIWDNRAALSHARDYGNKRKAAEYAQIVEDYYLKRDIALITQDAHIQAVNGRRTADICNDAIARLSKINPNSNIRTMPSREYLNVAYERSIAASEGKLQCVPTGLADLDNRIDGGYYPQDLIIIAARPGQGKTSLMCTMMLNQAEAGHRIAFFSLEMGGSQVAMRLVSQLTGIPFGLLRRGRLSGDQWAKYEEARDYIGSLGLFINDMPAIRPSQIRRELAVLQASGKIDIAYIDYVQIGGTDEKHDRRDLAIGEISGGLKAIAKDFDLPVVAAAQLSRAVEARADKEPALSDLRESGSLEQDADIVQFIKRDDIENVDGITQAKIITAKNRNGAAPTVTNLVFRGQYTKFENAFAVEDWTK